MFVWLFVWFWLFFFLAAQNNKTVDFSLQSSKYLL